MPRTRAPYPAEFRRQVVELAPGGLHLMLMDLTRPLEVGQTVTMELHFRRAGRLTVVAQVRTRME